MQKTEDRIVLERDGYNDRLFSGGIRGYLHSSRFLWAKKIIDELGPDSIIELGCFDGRLLDYVKPEKYVGLDAGWEGGIESAIDRFRGNPSIEFHKSSSPTDLARFESGTIDLGVALETLEHIPPHMLDDYLKELSRIVSGHVVISVPNEKCVVFLGKWLIKNLLLRDDDGEKYRPSEVLFATLGMTSKVKRDEHKGFDYDKIIDQIRIYFDIKSVSGVPFGIPFLSFSVGIVAKSRGR